MSHEYIRFWMCHSTSFDGCATEATHSGQLQRIPFHYARQPNKHKIYDTNEEIEKKGEREANDMNGPSVLCVDSAAHGSLANDVQSTRTCQRENIHCFARLGNGVETRCKHFSLLTGGEE